MIDGLVSLAVLYFSIIGSLVFLISLFILSLIFLLLRNIETKRKLEGQKSNLILQSLIVSIIYPLIVVILEGHFKITGWKMRGFGINKQIVYEFMNSYLFGVTAIFVGGLMIGYIIYYALKLIENKPNLIKLGHIASITIFIISSLILITGFVLMLTNSTFTTGKNVQTTGSIILDGFTYLSYFISIISLLVFMRIKEIKK